MMKKLTENQINNIRKMLLEGESVTDVAIATGVSRKTITKYKKTIPYAVYNEQTDTGDCNIKYDNLQKITEKEKIFTKKLEGDLHLYEDAEEGWVYHLDRQNYIMRTSGLWWGFIVYPESAPDDWLDKLAMTHAAIAISPLHDKDKWDHDSPECVDIATGEIIKKGARYKAGDPKKAHYHGIIVFDKSISFKEANELIRNITKGPYIQKIRSLKNAYDYFLHKTETAIKQNKYQNYDKDEIVLMNNFHILPNQYEIGVLQGDIFKTIKQHNYTQINQLVDHYCDSPEYLTIITSKPGLFTSYINSMWRQANPNGRVQYTHELTKEELKNFLNS
ncbi:MAG: Rep family protein [Butyrivibrio sp.]|nr:Rep family protein [Butyrivibrio sp.]